MSNPQNDPYAAVIADLELKRAQIDQLIESLKAFRQAGIIPPTMQNTDLTTGKDAAGEFAGKSMADATKIILLRNGQPMNNAAILEALEEGGLKSESQQPLNTLGSILNRRMNEVGDIIRVGRGIWGLKQWHSSEQLAQMALDEANTEEVSIPVFE